jgi:hypothetical protein
MRKLRTPVAIALSTSLIITALPPRPAKANPAVLPAVTACIASVGCVAALVIIGGITYYVITYEGQEPQYVPIQDQDESYDESADFYANSEAEAITKCLERARSLSQGATAECIGCVKMTATKPYRFTCTIRVEPKR